MVDTSKTSKDFELEQYVVSAERIQHLTLQLAEAKDERDEMSRAVCKAHEEIVRLKEVLFSRELESENLKLREEIARLRKALGKIDKPQTYSEYINQAVESLKRSG